MWMREDDSIQVPPSDPGDDTLTVCPAAILREWCVLPAGARWNGRRHFLMLVYPSLVGRN